MLVGLSGYLANYNGSFEFKSGETYPEELNYTFMRLFNSAFGALCVPASFFSTLCCSASHSPLSSAGPSSTVSSTTPSLLSGACG